MKKIYIILFLITTTSIELIFTILLVNNKIDYQNNMADINELIYSIENNFGNEIKYSQKFQYTIINETEAVIYNTGENNFTSLYDAYKNKATIIDFKIEQQNYKIIIANDYQRQIETKNITFIITISVVCFIQLVTFVCYYLYLNKRIITPFKKMNEFASRITTGNLDLPLNLDKNNNFGAFTEAFDIMRCEIKKANERERQANLAKKELVAKLSHDIKMPISSIKSYSELGLAINSQDKRDNYFEAISAKSDQINILINNLFNSTLEELEELTINPDEMSSLILENLITSSDYLEKNKLLNLPKCNIFADRLRLQQIFDNIFANSYKYANTEIETNAYIKEEYLIVDIRDFGNDFNAWELPLLTEKFKRGSNSKDKDGSGLGLYISKELLRKMNGNLTIEQANPGFKVLIYLRII